MKPIDYFYYDFTSQPDPTVNIEVIRATDPIADLKEDKLLPEVQNFWKKVYTRPSVKEYKKHRKNYRAQLRKAVKEMHKLMQECLDYFPQSSSIGEEFSLTQEKVNFFGEIKAPNLGGGFRFIGRFYTNYYKFGTGTPAEVAKLKNQRLTSVKRELEIMVAIISKEWQAIKPSLVGQPIAPDKIAIAIEIRNTFIVLANSLPHCSAGLFSIVDQSQKWQKLKRGTVSRKHDRYLKKVKMIEDSILQFNWDGWITHSTEEALRVSATQFGVKAPTDQDGHADLPGMKEISAQLSSKYNGTIAYVNRHFNHDYLADLATEEIVKDIQLIFAEYQDKPLADKIIKTDDQDSKDTPIYAQNFIKAMQPFIEQSIFTAEELIDLDEEGQPLRIIHLNYTELYIRCMPAGLKSCIAEKEVIDIRESVFGDEATLQSTVEYLNFKNIVIGTAKDIVAGTALAEAITKGWLFRLKILLDAGVVMPSGKVDMAIDLALSNTRRLNSRQLKIILSLVLTAARKNNLADTLKTNIDWLKRYYILNRASSEEIDPELFEMLFNQIKYDLNDDAKQLSQIANQTYGRYSAWAIVVLNMDAKIRIYLSQIPDLKYSPEVLQFIDKFDKGQASTAALTRYQELQPLLKLKLYAENMDIDTISKIFAEQKHFTDRALFLKVLANQASSQCELICEILARQAVDLETLLELSRYAPKIDLSNSRENFTAGKTLEFEFKDPAIVMINLTPLAVAIAANNAEWVQRLLAHKINPAICMYDEPHIFATSLILAARSQLSCDLFTKILTAVQTKLGTQSALSAFTNHSSPQLGSCLSNLVKLGKRQHLEELLCQTTVDLQHLDSKHELKIPGPDATWIENLLQLLQHLQATKLDLEECLACFVQLKPTFNLTSRERFEHYTRLFTLIHKQLPSEKHSLFFNFLIKSGQDLSALIALSAFITLDLNATYTITNHLGETVQRNLLCASIAGGDVFLVTEQLKKPVNVNQAEEKTGLTPLMLAVKLPAQNYIRAQSIVDQLLLHKSRLDLKDAEGNTVFHHAIRAPNAIFKTLVAHGLPEESVIDSIIEEATITQDYQKVMWLLPLVNMVDSIARQYSSDLEAKASELETEQILLMLLTAFHTYENDMAYHYLRMYADRTVGSVNALLDDDKFNEIIAQQFSYGRAHIFRNIIREIHNRTLALESGDDIDLLQKLEKHTDYQCLRGNYQALLVIIAKIPPNKLKWLISYSIKKYKYFWIPVILSTHGSIAKQYFNKEFKLIDEPRQREFINTVLEIHQPDVQKHILECLQDCLGVSLMKHIKTMAISLPNPTDSNGYWKYKSTTLFEEYTSVHNWVSHILHQVVNPRTAPLTYLLILTMKCNKRQDKTILSALCESNPVATKKLAQLYLNAKKQAQDNFALAFINSDARLSLKMGVMIAQYLTHGDLLSINTLASGRPTIRKSSATASDCKKFFPHGQTQHAKHRTKKAKPQYYYSPVKR